MPSIKRTGVKAVETKSGFEAYDGPEPSRRGVYRAVVKNVQYVVARTGSDGLRFGVEFLAADGDPKDHAQFDGYFMFARIWFGDKEAMMRREQNLYAALGVGDEPNIVYDENDADLEPGGKGAKIKTIGGKNPVGKIVNLDIKMSKYEGEPRPEVDSILVCSDKSGAGKASAPAPAVEDEEDEDADLMVEDEDAEETEEEQSREEREAELSASSLADLKSLATSDYDLDIKGLKKAGIVEAILDYEYSDEDGGPAAVLEEDDEEDDEVDEDEIEDDEEEDDEEDDEPDTSARIAELKGLDRVALKAALRAADPSAVVRKSMTDDDIRDAVIAAEFPDDETPF